MSSRPIGDEVLVRRAARGVAVQAAALVALAMLLLIGLVTLVIVRGQSGAADDLLRSAVATADDVGDPPPNTWLVMAHPSGTAMSPGLPRALLPELAAMRNRAISQLQLVTLEHDGNEYRVATGVTKGVPVQAVLDLATAHAERARVLQAMGLASAVGLLFAGLLGVLIGRRAVRPLAQALTLQRAFVADAGHELRTPVTLLSTRAQVLDRTLRRKGLSDEVLQDSGGVVQDTKRLGEVVDDLLVAADPRGDEAHEPVDLAQVAEAVVDSALRRFDSGGHRAGRAHYGLGLALTHDVANRHGGQLRLAPGEVGATFELALPALDEAGPRKS